MLLERYLTVMYRVVILIGDVFACAQLNSQSNQNKNPIYTAVQMSRSIRLEVIQCCLWVEQLFVSQLKFQLICVLAAGPSFGFAIFVFYTAEGDRGERKWLIIRSLCRHGGGE